MKLDVLGEMKQSEAWKKFDFCAVILSGSEVAIRLGESLVWMEVHHGIVWL